MHTPATLPALACSSCKLTHSRKSVPIWLTQTSEKRHQCHNKVSGNMRVQFQTPWLTAIWHWHVSLSHYAVGVFDQSAVDWLNKIVRGINNDLKIPFVNQMPINLHLLIFFSMITTINKPIQWPLCPWVRDSARCLVSLVTLSLRFKNRSLSQIAKWISAAVACNELTLKESSRFSPPHTSIPMSYVPRYSK